MAPGFDVDVRSNLGFLTQRLDEYQQKKIPFVTVYALTKTAQDIKDAEVQTMSAVFDRPTAFALNSLYVSPATKIKPVATIEFKGGFGSIPAWRFLGAEIEGGPRVKKSFERALERAGILRSEEFAVPTELAPLDGNGNMTGATITRILSDVQANPDPQSNTTRGTRVRRRRGGKGQYFVMRGRGSADGIYFRLGLRDIRPILLFVRQPRYAKRFPFRETAQRVFNRRFEANFNVGILRYGTPRPIPRAA